MALAIADAQTPPATPQTAEGLPQNIEQALAHPSTPLSRFGFNLDSLRRFYVARNYAPAWSGGAGEQRDATVALATLQDADEDGLDPAAYRLTDIRVREAVGSPPAMAEYDLLLTAGILDYMRDLRIGRVPPSQVGADIELPSIAFDSVATLADALRSDGLQAALSSLQPSHPEYRDLRNALARYRQIQIQGGWPQLGVTPIVKLDGSDSHVDLLWRRLTVEDSGIATETQTADAVSEAIKRYQARNGLTETGLVEKDTLTALDVPVEQRIDQIIANMERWRWLPNAFAPQYIEVNSADATLKAVDDGNVVLSSRVVAGKMATPTPIFFAKVVALTVNPYWNIPTTIARHELLPKEKRKPGYLASQHIFVAPDGSLKQEPGKDNALGFLKLEMPNRFDTYLHDTPARALFARSDRHFSHGCMRVQQIEPLASWVLTGDSAAAKERLDALIATGINQRISLDSPIPVYVLYWTAITDHDGAVGFRPDVYGRDSKLLAALAGQHLFGRVSQLTDCQAGAAG
jgi:murein L,D-transpeptidase YcbB/YkuD